jgi:nitrogen fixation/metabolism regulation signal transduction histidine kinase
MKKIINKSETTVLREAAEKVLKKKSSKTFRKHSETDSLKLIHELEVYQVELEMQNEELIKSRDEVRTANDRFTSLYDFAHTGYFTIDRKGKICMLNLSGAAMLGKERSTISNRDFRQFVTIDTLPQFNDFMLKAFETHTKENCHVRLITKGKQSIFVQIEGVVSADEDKCKIIVVDETVQKRTEELLKFKAHELELFDEFMLVKSHQMIVLKKEINHLLTELGQKEKFKIEE